MLRLKTKPFFVDVYTTWCGPCKNLDKQTFQDKELGDYINKNFVNLKWDAESELNRPDAMAFDVGLYPTMLLLDTNGKLVSRLSGFKSAKELIEIVSAFT